MARLLLMLALLIGLCWLCLKIFQSIPGVCRFLYRFCGSFVLCLLVLLLISGDQAGAKGGLLMLILFISIPFVIMWMVKSNKNE